MTIGLETVVSHFPERVLITAKDYAYLAPVMPEGFQTPKEVRRLRDENATEILGEEVTRKALDAAGIEPSDIDLILCQSIGGKFIIPGLGSYIHDKLGFRTETPAWNLQTCCASFVDGCQMAWNLIRAGEYQRILLVTVIAV